MFGGRAAAAGASPRLLLAAAPQLTLGASVFDFGLEAAVLPEPFSLTEQIITPTFLGSPPEILGGAEKPPVFLLTALPGELSAVDVGRNMMGSSAAAAGGGLPVIETMENGEEWFNNERRITRNIRMVGQDLLLEKGSEAYDRIHANPAIQRLEVYAETVTIRSPLHLPQM